MPVPSGWEFRTLPNAQSLRPIVSRKHDTQNTAGQSFPSLNLYAEKLRALTNWDPSYPGEKVDWYTEFVARRGPVSVSWIQQPADGDLEAQKMRDVQGLGLLTSGNATRIVAPLEDGSVCLWDIDHDNQSGRKRGSIVARTTAGFLSSQGPTNGIDKDSFRWIEKSIGTGVVECVSVDNVRNKAYFAVQNMLQEVDLETMQISSQKKFPTSISALSDASYPVPLTIATTQSLHLHDTRLPCTVYSSNSDVAEKVETVANFPASSKLRNDFGRLLAGDEPKAPASLLHPGSLSILHLPSHGSQESGEIYVAGRFPSILAYDRRNFPKLKSTIHSGSRLCSLSSLPYSFKAMESDLMQQNKLSVQAAREVKAQPGKTLIACGEYNGKGSLEMYGLFPEVEASGVSTSEQQPGALQDSTFKNRVSASRSKLLSVATHGTRLVVSDSDGQLKWVERNGSSLVRRWNINEYQVADRRGIFSLGTTSNGDVVRKIVPHNGANADRNPSRNQIERDELLLWTGEKIGILRFRSKSKFGAEEWEEKVESMEERMRRREERIYGQTMRRALERQADEVRFVQGLGLGPQRL